VAPRADEVRVRVRADRRPVRELGPAVLESGSTARPTLRVEARLVAQTGLAGPHGQPVHRAELTIENLSRTPIPGLEARFGFPQHDAIELLDGEARFPELAGRSSETVNLSMELGPGAPRVLPLELVVGSSRYGELARWPLELPVGGATVELQAPSIEVRQASRTAPAGPFALPIEVADDRKVDHLVVEVNGHKASWEAGGSGRLDTEVYFDLQPGHNRIVVRAEDDQGISGYRVVSVRGEPAEDAVDAGE
jgi:hypothetical protein